MHVAASGWAIQAHWVAPRARAHKGLEAKATTSAALVKPLKVVVLDAAALATGQVVELYVHAEQVPLEGPVLVPDTQDCEDEHQPQPLHDVH